MAVVSRLLKLPYANLIYYTFGLSFILLVISNKALAFSLLISTGYLLLTNNLLRTIFGLYIPTLIHVYMFTGAFLLLGALKHQNVSGYVAFFTFLLCPVMLCLLFTNIHTTCTQWAISNYAHFKKLNTNSLRRQNKGS